MLAEDEPELRDIVMELLEPFRIQVIPTANGIEALDILSGRDNIDAILSDLHMPAMDGLSFLRKVREWSLETPFVLFSGRADKSSVIEALRLKALDFLEKPFEPRELALRLKSAVELGYQKRRFRAHVDELSLAGVLPSGVLSNLNQAKKAVLSRWGK